MLWSRESDVVPDRQDDLLRLWRSTNSIDRSGTEQDVGFGFSGGSTICGKLATRSNKIDREEGNM